MAEELTLAMFALAIATNVAIWIQVSDMKYKQGRLDQKVEVICQHVRGITKES